MSGLAFLAACCTTKGGISKAERKQLVKERDSIQEIIKKRESSCVYGSPEIIQAYGLETLRLRAQLDSINYKLGEDVDLEKSAQQYENQKKKVDEFKEKEQRRSELTMRLEQLLNTIHERESSCIYGSPEVMEQYGRETQRLRQEAEQIQKEIKALDEPTPDTITKEEIDALPVSTREGRAADVLYGSPDPMRK